MNDAIETGEFSEALSGLLIAPTAFIGVGNSDRCDDGAGVVLAKLLAKNGLPHVFIAGETPENFVTALSNGRFASIVFLDAVDVGAEAGSVAVMNATDIISRFPQVSTHKISIGTLARLISGPDRPVHLIGIQPHTIALNPDSGLSATVARTVTAIGAAITDAVRNPHSTKRSHLHAA
jgi:hydrogenase maturation protease